VKIPNPEVQQRLEQLALEGLDLVKQNMIWHEHGRYHVFGEYELEVQKTGCVMHSRRHDTQRFGSVKTALSWCIATKYQRHDVASEIAVLDQQHQIAEADLEVRSHMARRHSDPVRKETAMLKVEHRRGQLALVTDRLTKCVNLAKYWQIRGFNNETARTGRSPSQRTSRPGI
jgi:hypothetical protein